MDLAMGALGSLLPKLGELLKDEYKLQKGVKKDVVFLEAELTTIHTALSMVAEVPRDELDNLVKLWAGDLRELSYVMEDVVDRLLVSMEDQAASTKGFMGLMGKMTNHFKKAKDRRQIATAIKDIKEHVQDVSSRRER
jgi:disease resistance protein RPM1